MTDRIRDRRLGWALLTAFVASMVAFVLFWTIPNVDPAYWLGGERHGHRRRRERAVDLYGLDDPLPVQYVRLMKGIIERRRRVLLRLRPDRVRRPDRKPPCSLPRRAAGDDLARRRRGGDRDRPRRIAWPCLRPPPRAMARPGDHRRGGGRLLDPVAGARRAAVGLPLPTSGRSSPIDGYAPLTENPFEWFWHLLLPWIAAALPFAGAYVQVVRSSLLDRVDEDWVRTARAKGLSEKQVLRRHVLRNALIPPINLWGLDFSHAFGGYPLRRGDLRPPRYRPTDRDDARRPRPAPDRRARHLPLDRCRARQRDRRHHRRLPRPADPPSRRPGLDTPRRLHVWEVASGLPGQSRHATSPKASPMRIPSELSATRSRPMSSPWKSTALSMNRTVGVISATSQK